MIPACHYHRQWAGCGKAEQSLVLYQMQHSDRAPWYVVVGSTRLCRSSSRRYEYS